MAKNDKKAPETTEADTAKTQNTAPAEDAAAPAAEEAGASTEGLVEMTKGGERLHVHPTTVKAHEAAGWEQA